MTPAASPAAALMEVFLLNLGLVSLLPSPLRKGQKGAHLGAIRALPGLDKSIASWDEQRSCAEEGEELHVVCCRSQDERLATMARRTGEWSETVRTGERATGRSAKDREVLLRCPRGQAYLPHGDTPSLYESCQLLPSSSAEKMAGGGKCAIYLGMRSLTVFLAEPAGPAPRGHQDDDLVKGLERSGRREGGPVQPQADRSPNRTLWNLTVLLMLVKTEYRRA